MAQSAKIRPRVLRRTQFGNPLLRQKSRQLDAKEILSAKTKRLIGDMFFTLKKKKYGVGLAAPQVGQGIALSIINIHSTDIRPDLPKSKWAKMVIINPEITGTYGQRTQLWEGCISFTEAFAKVPRYKKVRVKYLDEKGKTHNRGFSGLLAHVLQHEVDHLNGVLFVDRIKDSSSWMTKAEYIKHVKAKVREQ